MYRDGSRSQAGRSTSLIDPASSRRDVTYSCGHCGYALNLSSSHRNTTNIGSKYGKAIKKGVVSFVAVDESRFSHTDELSCRPYFHSKDSWGFYRQRTILGCRKCSRYIGAAYDADSGDPSTELGSPTTGRGEPDRKKYLIRIDALQPTTDDSEIQAIEFLEEQV